MHVFVIGFVNHIDILKIDYFCQEKICNASNIQLPQTKRTPKKHQRVGPTTVSVGEIEG